MKLSNLEKEKLLKVIDKLHGSSKRRTTDEQLHEARERAFEFIAQKVKRK